MRILHVDRRRSLPPTPLQIQKNEVIEPHKNVFENASCVISSSKSLNGTYFKMPAGNETIVSARENSPFLLVDLGGLYYVDQVSFTCTMKEVLLWCSNSSSHYTLTQQNITSLPYSWQKVVHIDDNDVSIHVHAPCSVFRIQGIGIDTLTLQNMNARGRLITDQNTIGCLSGHDAFEVCSGKGQCVNGECSCGILYTGERCDSYTVFVVLYENANSLLILCLAAILFVIFVTDSTRKNHWKQEYELVKQTLSDDVEKESNKPKANAGTLHLLFSSPLVYIDADQNTLRPVQALNIDKEFCLLKQSLLDANNPITVNVSCGTMHSFHSVLTIGNTNVLHFSGHCTHEFMAFENASGQMHPITMPILRGMLNTTNGHDSFKQLRVVVLNACFSKRAAVEFVLAGVPHVVAIDGKVLDTTAAAFSRAFYLSLGCGRSVLEAFEGAVKAIQTAPDGATATNRFVLFPVDSGHEEIVFSKSSNDIVQSWPQSRTLPSLTDDFVGRNADCWHLVKHLVDYQRRVIVTYSDESGVGVSQMAIAVGRRLDQRRICKDGVFYASVKYNKIASHPEVRLACVLAAIFRTLGEFWQGIAMYVNDGYYSDDENIAEARRTNRAGSRYIIDRLTQVQPHCLLIIDPCSECPLAIEFLGALLRACPNIQLILCSDAAYVLPQNFDVNVINMKVKPLSPASSADLFLRHVQKRVSVSRSPPTEATSSTLSDHPFLTQLEGNPRKIIHASKQINLLDESHEPVALDEIDLNQ